MTHAWRSRVLALLLLGTSMALTLAVAELGLRLRGHRPWPGRPALENTPTVTQPDPELGWSNRPGSYSFSVVPGAPPVAVTIQPDGSRLVPSAPQRPGDEVWMMGCSFTYGWGVDDSEGYVEVAQQRLSSRATLVNLAVPAHGTVQTALLFHRRAATSPRPRAVVYGLMADHGDRNLGLAIWMRTLARSANTQAWVRMPYARLAGPAGFELFPAAGYDPWPGASRSALLSFLQERTGRLADRRLAGTADTLTLRLLLDLDRQVRASGADFHVALLYLLDSQKHIAQELERAGVSCLDLSTGVGFPGPGSQLPVDLHPNASTHRAWGIRLASLLAERLPR